MTAATLDRLLPIHLHRERRALRNYQAYKQAFELALAEQTRASTTIEHLQRSHAGAVAEVLEGGAMSAGDAQAALDQALSIEQHIASTRKRLAKLVRQTREAHELAEEARQAYAARVRATRKLTEACRQQGQRENRLEAHRAEQGTDDDFSTRWQHPWTQRNAA